MHQFEKALESFQSALSVHSTAVEPELLWRVWHGLSSTHAQLARPKTAIFLGKQAVNVLQGLRLSITGLDRSFQLSFLENKETVYKDLASLLIDEGRLVEAQRVLELFKEREYFEYLRAHPQDPARPAEMEFSVPEEPAANETVQWIALAKKRVALLQKGDQSLTADERKQLDRLTTMIDSAYNAFRDGLANFEAEYRRAEQPSHREFPMGELKSVVGFQRTLKDVDANSAVVYFLTTPEKVRIIVALADETVRPFYRDSPVGQRALNRLIADYRETLQSPAKDPLPEARKLYDHLLRPIEKDIESAGAKTLLVYLDGALRYLPLSALHDGRSYVAERYAVVVYTAAMKDKLASRTAETWRVWNGRERRGPRIR